MGDNVWRDLEMQDEGMLKGNSQPDGSGSSRKALERQRCHQLSSWPRRRLVMYRMSLEKEWDWKFPQYSGLPIRIMWGILNVRHLRTQNEGLTVFSPSLSDFNCMFPSVVSGKFPTWFIVCLLVSPKASLFFDTETQPVGGIRCLGSVITPGLAFHLKERNDWKFTGLKPFLCKMNLILTKKSSSFNAE